MGRMALLKGNSLRFTGTEAIVGADVILAPAEDDAVTSVIPQATPEPGLGDLDDFDLDGGLDDLFAENDAAPVDAGPAWDQPIQDFERAREHVLFGANEATDNDNNAFGES